MRSSSLATTYSPRLLGRPADLGTTAPAWDTAGWVLGTGHKARGGISQAGILAGPSPEQPLRGQDKAVVTAGPQSSTGE